MVRARVSSRRIPVRTFTHFGGTPAISRRRGRHGFVLAAFAGLPCWARLVVEPVTAAASRTVFFTILNAVAPACRCASRAGAFVCAAFAVLDGGGSLHLDFGCCAFGVGCTLESGKGGFGLVRTDWTVLAVVRCGMVQDASMNVR